MHHRTIAPQAWLDELNPDIPFEELDIRVPVEAEPFPPSYPVPVAAVNGFGYGGTNAHAILAGTAPPPGRSRSTGAAPGAGLPALGPHRGRGPRGSPALRATCCRRSRPTRSPPGADRRRCARRRCVDPALHHPFRARGRLRRPRRAGRPACAPSRPARAARRPGGRPRRRTAPVFVFTGMGPQWWRMGRDLLARRRRLRRDRPRDRRGVRADLAAGRSSRSCCATRGGRRGSPAPRSRSPPTSWSRSRCARARGRRHAARPPWSATASAR